MQFTTTVTQKGQATIPIQIRKKLGLKARSKVTFEIKSKNEATLKAVPDFFTMKGSLKTNKPFNIKAWDRAIGKMFKEEYSKKYGKRSPRQ